MGTRERRKEQLRRQRRNRLIGAGVGVVVVGIVVLIVVAVTGGSDTEAGPALDPLAAQGKQLAVQRSCVGCHGRKGEGGANHTGPPWIGLYGSTVTLDDGTKVTADDAYLIEAMVQPKAKHTAGWGQMPETQLSQSDVTALLAYIKALAVPAPGATSTTAKG